MLLVTSVTQHKRECAQLLTARLLTSDHNHNSLLVEFGTDQIDIPRWPYLHPLGQLKILKEPSLYAQSKTTEKQSYRFLWMRSFHELVSIRFDLQSDGKAMITVKKGTGTAEAFSTQLARGYRRMLTQEQSKWFLDEVRQSDFWNLVGHQDPDDDGVSDGARWVIEGTKDRRYHVVDRWSPESG